MELFKKISYLLYSVLLMTSCLPEEDPITPRDKGGVTTVQIEMGSLYTNQIWYDLSAQKVVKTVNRYSYDMIYDPTLPVTPISLNSARISSVAFAQITSFSDKIDPTNLAFEESDPSGNQDSSAFSKIGFRLGEIYVVKLGVDEHGNQAGYVKIRLLENGNNSYILEHAQLNDSSPTKLELPNLANAEQRAIHFKQNEVLDIFPRQDEYDLLFTNYTHLFYEQNLTYSVTGVLLNSSSVKAQELKGIDIDFFTIDADVINSENWSSNMDEIGYDWKSFSLETNSFSVDANRVFVVKDRYGYLYKIRFIDFYNTQGEKGNPTFEIESL